MTWIVRLAIAIFALSTAARAVTISVVDYAPIEHGALLAAGSNISEDFEGEGNANGEAEVGPSLNTDVGRFYSMGGTGTGGTVRRLSGNSGTELALRDGNTYGRRDTAGGRWYLDSNDTYGIGWDVVTGGAFNAIHFTLSDGSDTGAYLRIVVGSTVYEQRSGSRLANGNTQLVSILFDDLQTAAFVQLVNYQSDGTTRRLNDGFSVDGASVGIAAIPLPAAVLMLVTALGGLVLLRRR